MTDYLTDGSHLLITGPTGSKTDFGGKTALATWMADGPARERDLVVFFNPKQDDVGKILDDYHEVGSVDELADAMGRGHRRLILTPTDFDWEAVSERLRDFIAELPRDMSKWVILDEVPELSDEAVLTFVRVFGNGATCKSVLLAQSPTDLSTSIIKQCIPIWVGPVPSTYQAWFRANDFAPAYDHIAANHSPYQWTAILGPGEGDWDYRAAVDARYGEV